LKASSGLLGEVAGRLNDDGDGGAAARGAGTSSCRAALRHVLGISTAYPERDVNVTGCARRDSSPFEACRWREFPGSITEIHIYCAFLEANCREKEGAAAARHFVRAAERSPILCVLDAAAAACQGDAAANHVTLAESRTIILEILRIALFPSSPVSIAALVHAELERRRRCTPAESSKAVRHDSNFIVVAAPCGACWKAKSIKS
jgi:hypothetical protein